MRTMKVLRFDKALDSADGKKHLLLGNGFSCALKPGIFRYQALRDAARFDVTSEKIFAALDTMAFEKAARALDDSAKVALCFGVGQSRIDKMAEYSQLIKRKLVETLAATHPSRPSEITDAEYRSCQDFLKHFLADGHIFTLNYDLLLYWTLMRWLEEGGPRPVDGFGGDEDDPDASYVVWDDSNRSTNVHYLHGALHLLDAGSSLHKITWCRTDVPLIDQINAALDRNVYPLFVSEGTAEQKMERIMHSMYLSKGLRSFKAIGGSLFLYGVSLDDNDTHIIKAIQHGNIRRLFVGLYGDPGARYNQAIINKASLLPHRRSLRIRRTTLEVAFFDSGSAHVWDRYPNVTAADILGKWPFREKVLATHGV